MVETTAAARPRPGLHRSSFLRELLDTLILIGAIYALVNLLTVRFFIDGPSMQPNFHAGEFLVVSRLSYLFDQPAQGDIVVFEAPGARPDDPPLIKRLIGLPGDTVEVRNTQVYVNGEALDEPYINEPCSQSMCRNAVWELGDNEYFFMGDNRNNSRDSRRFGPVTREHVVGEALVRYWPPSEWGIVEHFRYAEP